MKPNSLSSPLSMIGLTALEELMRRLKLATYFGGNSSDTASAATMPATRPMPSASGQRRAKARHSVIAVGGALRAEGSCGPCSWPGSIGGRKIEVRIVSVPVVGGFGAGVTFMLLSCVLIERLRLYSHSEP